MSSFEVQPQNITRFQFERFLVCFWPGLLQPKVLSQRTRPYEKYYDVLFHYRRVNSLSVEISFEFSPGKQAVSEALP